MRQLARSTAVLIAVGLTSAHAQMPDGFDAQKCPEPRITSWCPSQLSKDGWALKYSSNSPQELMGAYWRYEVWTRQQLAVGCVLVGGGRDVRVNECHPLTEVQ